MRLSVCRHQSVCIWDCTRVRVKGKETRKSEKEMEGYESVPQKRGKRERQGDENAADNRFMILISDMILVIQATCHTKQKH